MSLEGLTVAITASRRALELAHLINTFGGTPYISPTVGIETSINASKETVDFINKLVKEKLDYVVFMTGPGVYSLMSAAKKLQLEGDLIEALKKVIVVARSLKPKIALAHYGIKTDIVPEENTAEGIVKQLKKNSMQGKKIGVLWHGSYFPILKNEMSTAGAEVFEFSIYSYSLDLKESGAKILEEMGFKYVYPDQAKVIKLIEAINNGLVHVITFTSPPSARDLFKIAEDHKIKEPLLVSLNNNVIVVAIGPSTKKALEENKVQVDVMPQIYKMGPMV
ncbi:MAG TPA: uroporphyrinogen-III synthase, partial [Nitrososphaeraceae archaeon]|nr:uroporphyrinogen-III synthase [Nitrososphaeraceae archaeon]